MQEELQSQVFHYYYFFFLLINSFSNTDCPESLLGPPFSIQIIQFCGNLSKVVGQTYQTFIFFLKEVGW